MTLKPTRTVAEVARMCQVRRSTVRKWFDSGRLRGYRLPDTQERQIPVEHLIRFLEERGRPTDGIE